MSSAFRRRSRYQVGNTWSEQDRSRLFRSLRSRRLRYARFSLRSKNTTTQPGPMPHRRTLRVTTRWTDEEWLQIEDAARERGVPPARYVREAALAAKLPPRVRARARARQGAHELVRQLKRVLSNLHQLLRLAEDEGAESMGLVLESVIRGAEDAIRVASRRDDADVLAAALVDAGRLLNELARRGNGSQALPSDDDLAKVLIGISVAVNQVLR